MSLGEQILVRIFAVLLISLVVFCFRLVGNLIKKGFRALTGSGKDEKQKVQPANPPVKPIQPPPVQPVKPVQTPPVQPVKPVQTPPVQPVQPVKAPPVQPVPTVQQQYPSGDIPLGGEWSWAKAVSGYRLRILNGPLAGKVYELRADFGGSVYTLGRNANCNIQFPPNTPGISGQHCRIVVRSHTGSTGAVLEDCGSTYGTFLADGRQVMPGQECRLGNGDTFLLAGRNGTACRLEQM